MGTSVGYRGCVRGLRVNDVIWSMPIGDGAGLGVQPVDRDGVTSECSADQCMLHGCLYRAGCRVNNGVPQCLCPSGFLGTKCEKRGSNHLINFFIFNNNNNNNIF